MCYIRERLVTKNTIQILCKQRVLDPCLWKLADEKNMFLVFERMSHVVGAVEFSVDKSQDEGYIHMIEVSEKDRNKGFGSVIVKKLQEGCKTWKCVPIDESTTYFFGKCGFFLFDHPTWIWTTK